MSIPQKRKYTKRNFDQEAEYQIKLLEQKAREDFLINFSQYEEDATPKTVEMASVPHRDDTESKVYISANAKSILEKWMYEHRLYCYPTKAEKQALAAETGLSVQKISNWFINSRRRMLPKMLQTEGRNPVNFTISRKKKKTNVTTTSIGLEDVCPTSFLSNYGIAEESKIIDQTSIFYGNEIEMQRNDTYYERALQEFIVPYTETDDEESKTSNPTTIEPRSEVGEEQLNHVTRGILYDQATQSKCLFIIIDSPK